MFFITTYFNDFLIFIYFFKITIQNNHTKPKTIQNEASDNIYNKQMEHISNF